MFQGEQGLDLGVDISAMLESVYLQVGDMSYEERLRLWRPKCSKFIISILHKAKEVAVLQHYLATCWAILHISLELPSRQSTRDPTFEDYDTMRFAVEDLKIVELIARELETGENDEVLLACTVSLTPICLYAEFAARILQCNIPALLIPKVSDHVPSQLGQGMLIAITNLAIHPQTHNALKMSGVCDLAQEQMRGLRSQNLDVLDCALSSAFVLCRIGESNNVENEILIRKLKWILNEVVLAGPGGIVLRSRWNPANIVMDLSILASKSSEMLVKVVPTVSNAAYQYGEQNARLIKFTAQFAWEMMFIDAGKEELMKNKRKLIFAFNRAGRSYDTDLMTKHLCRAVVTELLKDTREFTLREMLTSKWQDFVTWMGWLVPMIATRQRTGDAGVLNT